MPKKTMAGTAPIQKYCIVCIPYWTPLAEWPMISTAPKLAEIKAKPVTQDGSPRPERKKSMELDTLARAAHPIPKTKTK